MLINGRLAYLQATLQACQVRAPHSAADQLLCVTKLEHPPSPHPRHAPPDYYFTHQLVLPGGQRHECMPRKLAD